MRLRRKTAETARLRTAAAIAATNDPSVPRFELTVDFEEFSLLMELRSGVTGPRDIRIRTQKPLAIYVPSERLQLWQTGRSESKIAAKIARHPGVELDKIADPDDVIKEGSAFLDRVQHTGIRG